MIPPTMPDKVWSMLSTVQYIMVRNGGHLVSVDMHQRLFGTVMSGEMVSLAHEMIHIFDGADRWHHEGKSFLSSTVRVIPSING